jgi:hypothetical protein
MILSVSLFVDHYLEDPENLHIQEVEISKNILAI